MVINGSFTNFLNHSRGQTILLTDGIVSDANGYIANVDLRIIKRIVNNSIIIIDEPCTFTSNVGYYQLPMSAYCIKTISKFDMNMMILKGSRANEDIHFVSNAVNYITFTGGSGYTNTDYIVFSGANAKEMVEHL